MEINVIEPKHIYTKKGQINFVSALPQFDCGNEVNAHTRQLTAVI